MLRSSSKLTGRAITPQIITKPQSTQSPASTTGHPFPHLPLLPGDAYLFWFPAPSSPALKTPGFCSHFTLIHWADKPTTGLNWQHHWGNASSHQLHFWTQKGQHRSLLVQASRVCPLANLFKWLFLSGCSSEAGSTPLGTWPLVPPTLSISSR